MDVGGTASVTATLYGSSDTSAISWTSGNESVATVAVGEDGVATISGVAAGSTTITVTTGTFSKSVSVNVLATVPSDLVGVSYTTTVAETNIDGKEFSTSNDNMDALLAIFTNGVNEGDTNIVTAVSASKVYQGFTGSSGTFIGTFNGLKFGTSSASGQLVLTTSVNVYKADVSVVAWNATDTLSVGGADAWTPGEANKSMEHTFEFNGTTSVSIDWNKRGFLYAITLYYSAAELAA